MGSDWVAAGNSVSVSATSTAANTSMTTLPRGRVYNVVNDDGSAGDVAVGPTSSVSVTSHRLRLAPGESGLYYLDADEVTLYYISDSTATVRFTPVKIYR